MKFLPGYTKKNCFISKHLKNITSFFNTKLIASFTRSWTEKCC